MGFKHFFLISILSISLLQTSAYAKSDKIQSENQDFRTDEINNSIPIDFGTINFGFSNSNLESSEDDRLSIDAKSTKTKISVPLSLKLSKERGGSLKGLTLDVSARHTVVKDKSLSTPLVANSFGTNLVYLDASRDKDIFYLSAGANNKKSETDSTHFNTYNLMGFNTYRYSKTSQFFYGLTVAQSELTGTSVFPILGFKTDLNTECKLALILPMLLKLEYQLNEKTELIFSLKPNSELIPADVKTLNLTTTSLNNTSNNTTLIYSETQINVSGELKYKFNRIWVLGGELALTKKGQSVITDADKNKISTTNYNKGGYLGISLSYLAF